ncbi:hypothetical protein, partial [Ralstonia pseudosolanacearum]|uniref:hypothetical protein n=1 Tax=Ralstonia pseudosolanacearum TaxID=1310165 RepID=UPI003D169336
LETMGFDIPGRHGLDPLQTLRRRHHLGLAIVREIARVHGAAVTLSDTAGGGLTVSVRFAEADRAPAG